MTYNQALNSYDNSISNLKARPVKSGKIIYYFKNDNLKDWSEGYFRLLSDSTLKWFNCKNNQPDMEMGSTNLAQVYPYISIGKSFGNLYYNQSLPSGLKLYDENLSLSIPIVENDSFEPNHVQNADRLWLQCEDNDHFDDWVQAINSTMNIFQKMERNMFLIYGINDCSDKLIDRFSETRQPQLAYVIGSKQPSQTNIQRTKSVPRLDYIQEDPIVNTLKVRDDKPTSILKVRNETSRPIQSSKYETMYYLSKSTNDLTPNRQTLSSNNSNIEHTNVSTNAKQKTKSKSSGTFSKCMNGLKIRVKNVMSTDRSEKRVERERDGRV